MINNLLLVGRLVNDCEIEKNDASKKTIITLAVSRPFKNENGEYETDFFDCILWNSIAENVVEYCHKGDVLGIKGSLQSVISEKEDGIKEKSIRIIAEKVISLSSKKADE